MTQPKGSAQGVTYGYLPASERTAQLAYQVLWATVFLSVLTKLVLLRLRGVPVSAFTTDLVSLLFVYHAWAGSTVYEGVGGYSVYVWTMLLMCFAAIVLARRKAPDRQARERSLGPAVAP